MRSFSLSGKHEIYFRPSDFFYRHFSSESIRDGSVAQLTAHTAFTDPTTPPDALPRESIGKQRLTQLRDQLLTACL